MKRRWIVIIFTICFGMGMLLPVHAQEKDKIWAGTNSKIEKIEEALYKDFDDDVKEYQSGHSNDVAEQVADNVYSAEVLTLGTKLKTPIMHVQQHVCMDIMLDMT